MHAKEKQKGRLCCMAPAQPYELASLTGNTDDRAVLLGRQTDKCVLSRNP